MFKLLGQPYPADESISVTLRKAFVIGLFVALFLLVFQPFELDRWGTSYKTLKIIGFGVVTTLITFFNTVFWKQLLRGQFSGEKWTVGREIVFITANLVLIAIANQYYLAALLGSADMGYLHNWSMFLITFLVGIFPITGLVVLNYITQLKKYSQSAAELPIHHSPSIDQEKVDTLPNDVSQPTDDVLRLVADNEKDTLNVAVNDLLFVESSDNYCTVVYLKNDRPARPLLRSSLSRVEKQIDRSDIVRCHRSYVVNLNRIERVTGNAQGYKLHLLNGQFQIPVARQYNETLVARLKAL
ncbi:LytTR family transcriptional regulator [Spirosoma sp. BT702]|uniref:LytTR family transcriptional regulator n=1 Tax=Spirosoma profusum TaxID=2771354 RepID=A0A926XXV4_9BACT|nr:LytTR family DNA-binding domain-containing protein [Spirosoma profusum]MBD2699798.1 LytTR family transcriptional regulator [Spirosoma profusum]